MSDDCGCCATPPSGTAIENRPGLTALAYRPGTFMTFRQELIEALARKDGVSTLTSRGSDDYTISTIELWSAVADVLSFYQERIANESFLRTAVHRDSMLRLVRLLGYELAPGVAAQTWLAFTVERGQTTTVPPRTRVKSVPVADELASTFETMEPLEADSTWNALEPFRLKTHTLRAGDTGAEFDGVTTALSPGDVLLFTGEEKRNNPFSTVWDLARVRTVTPDPKLRRTKVTWWPPLGSTAGRQFPATPSVFVLRQRTGVFGYNAPDWHLISDAGKSQLLGLQSGDQVTEGDRREWPQFEIYAPQDPNKPRVLVENGVLDIYPTAQSVADAAIAAATASKDAVLADLFSSAATAASSIANAIGKANAVSGVLTELLIKAAATQADAAAAQFANAQAVVAGVQAQLTGLPGQITGTLGGFALEFAIPPPVGGPAVATANLIANVANITSGFQNAAINMLSDTFVKAVVALQDLLGVFKKLQDDGGFNTPTPAAGTLKAALDEAARAATAAFTDVSTAAGKIATPIGAIATEKAVAAAVQWTIDNHAALDTVLPSSALNLTDAQRVGIAAMVAAKFVEISFYPATFMGNVAVNVLTPSNDDIAKILSKAIELAAIGVAAGVAAQVASAAALAVVLTTAPLGFPALVTGVVAAAALWPLVFAGVVAIHLLGQAAQPGAKRVADDVIDAVLLALQIAHPEAPWRYQERILLHDRVDLDTVYPRIVRDSWVVLSSPLRDELYRVSEVQQTARTDFALTGNVTRVRLAGNSLAPVNGVNPYFHVRETAVFGASDELRLALDTITTPFAGATIDVAGTPAESALGRTLLIAGVDAVSGERASSLVTLVGQAPAPADGTGAAHTILTIEPGVTRAYALDGLVVHGNVTYATNGETVRNEIVGDGDMSQGFQKFSLRKKPVTHAPDRQTGGVNSSLTLLVNGVKWHETPTLYGAAPTDPVFTSRIADDTTTTLTFGDGVTGARLPTGRQNLVAQYRQGIGAAANVAAGRLTSLVDRPRALRGATNPGAAEGGVDPETLAGARVAAPGSVRTFGRAVSLRDFEDATLFNGIVAKASATWVWTGERRAIHLTVAVAGGGALSEDVITRLRTRLDGQRDTNQRLLIDNYARVPIVIDAALTVDDRHVAADVLAAARAALLDTFAFETRGFGQPVFLSDVFTLLQQVPGVLAVDVNVLNLKNNDPAFRVAHGVDDTLGQPQPRLLMLPARADAAAGTVRPAELAVIDADGDVTLSATGGLTL